MAPPTRKAREGKARLVGYCRVSTDMQAEEGVSLDAQQEKIRAFVALRADSFELVGMAVDAGFSGKTIARPKLQEALEALEEGEADGIIVVRLDRLTRSVRDLGDMIETYFGKYELVSVNESIDTRSAGGRLMLNIIGSVSQWEREAIAERVRDAMAHLKTQGIQLGDAALGWAHTDDRDTNGRRVIVTVPDELATVQRIVALDEQGMSLRQIAAVVESEGRRTKRGGRWQPETIKRVLLRARVRG